MKASPAEVSEALERTGEIKKRKIGHALNVYYIKKYRKLTFVLIFILLVCFSNSNFQTIPFEKQTRFHFEDFYSKNRHLKPTATMSSRLLTLSHFVSVLDD